MKAFNVGDIIEAFTLDNRIFTGEVLFDNSSYVVLRNSIGEQSGFRWHAMVGWRVLQHKIEE